MYKSTVDKEVETELYYLFIKNAKEKKRRRNVTWDMRAHGGQ